MSDKILCICKWGVWVAVLSAAMLPFEVQSALASNRPQISGTYDVAEKTDLGSQEQIRMRIHLVNHGMSMLSIERMTIWDFSRPEKGGTRACAVALGAHASADTTQVFTVRRADYQLWQRGVQPRVVLQLVGPGNTRSRTVVRLNRISGQEAK